MVVMDGHKVLEVQQRDPVHKQPPYIMAQNKGCIILLHRDEGQLKEDAE